jgi:transcription antitermination factor NusG
MTGYACTREQFINHVDAVKEHARKYLHALLFMGDKIIGHASQNEKQEFKPGDKIVINTPETVFNGSPAEIVAIREEKGEDKIFEIKIDGMPGTTNLSERYMKKASREVDINKQSKDLLAQFDKILDENQDLTPADAFGVLLDEYGRAPDVVNKIKAELVNNGKLSPQDLMEINEKTASKIFSSIEKTAELKFTYRIFGDTDFEFKNPETGANMTANNVEVRATVSDAGEITDIAITKLNAIDDDGEYVEFTPEQMAKVRDDNFDSLMAEVEPLVGMEDLNVEFSGSGSRDDE